MQDDTDRPSGDDTSRVAKVIAPKPASVRKGFDPASLKGGKHPGGKVMRGTRTMQSAKSRGRG